MHPATIRHTKPRRCKIQILLLAGLGQEWKSPAPSPLPPAPQPVQREGKHRGLSRDEFLYITWPGWQILTSVFWVGLITSTAPCLSPFLVTTSSLISFSLLSQPPSPLSHSLNHTSQDPPTLFLFRPFPFCLFLISPSFFSLLFFSSLTKILCPGFVPTSSPWPYRLQALGKHISRNTSSHWKQQAVNSLGKACHGPARPSASCHPQVLLQTKVVIPNMDFGFFWCQEDQIRLSPHPATWGRSWYLCGVLGSPRSLLHPQQCGWLRRPQKPAWRGSVLPCPCNSYYHQQMAKYYHTFITFTSKRPHNRVENGFPCQKHLFIKWHMYIWHLPFYMQYYKMCANVNTHFLSHSWHACQSKEH